MISALSTNAFQFTSNHKSNSFALEMSSTAPLVTIGTRGSPLALAQAYETKRLLGLHFPELASEGAVEIKKIMTKVQIDKVLLRNCNNILTLLRVTVF